jgi:ABC-type antimicrobial peptide transport system permease subunit
VSFVPRLAALWRNLTQRARVERDLDDELRAALGAVHGQAVRLILGQTGRLALAGIAIGLTAAALVTRLLEGMLYGVQPLDPISFAGGALLFGTLALVASLIPARRAASVNPVEALRAE